MENQNTHTTPLPKPLLWSLCLLTAAIIFKLFNRLYGDYDLWWHIFMGNEIISKFEMFNNILIICNNRGLVRPPKETYFEHMDIINALEKHNAEEAEKAMKAHIQKSRALLEGDQI